MNSINGKTILQNSIVQKALIAVGSVVATYFATTLLAVGGIPERVEKNELKVTQIETVIMEMQKFNAAQLEINRNLKEGFDKVDARLTKHIERD